jgi:hypothetical protein
MSGQLKLKAASLGGDIALVPTDTASSVVVTVPAITGTMVTTGSTGVVSQAMLGAGVAGNGPAFSAFLASAQSVTALTFTKIQCATEEFDTNSNYDPTTNYRFTPTVAGYYQVSAALGATGTINAQLVQVLIYKNGSSFKKGSLIITSGTGALASSVSALVYCNGTTDYLEAYGNMNGAGTTTFIAGADTTYFQASLVRSA